MPKGQCDADEFQAGSDAVLDVLEYSAEQLYVRLLDTVSHIPQAAAQVTALRDIAFVESNAFISGFVNRQGVADLSRNPADQVHLCQLWLV